MIAGPKNCLVKTFKDTVTFQDEEAEFWLYLLWTFHKVTISKLLLLPGEFKL